MDDALGSASTSLMSRLMLNLRDPRLRGDNHNLKYRSSTGEIITVASTAAGHFSTQRPEPGSEGEVMTAAIALDDDLELQYRYRERVRKGWDVDATQRT